MTQKDEMIQNMVTEMQDFQRKTEEARRQREAELEQMRREQDEERRREREQAARQQELIVQRMEELQGRKLGTFKAEISPEWISLKKCSLINFSL